ncbi:MAG: beta-ketoacyl synthase N-terminal-like domain-containing protein [Candidatus Sericytochromatia bacterium]|nr:beta-ketoacyl synthase N-terminal-like domain-containing protein [Candidatus Sericytochromatia bacterium]
MSTAWVPVAIVGVGGIFPDAPTPEALWANVVAARSAADRVETSRWVLPPDEIVDASPGVGDRVASSRVCAVKDWTPDFGDLPIPNDLLGELDPLYHLAIEAARQACATLLLNAQSRQRAGVILGNIVLPDEGAGRDAVAFLDGQGDVQPYAYRGAGLLGGFLARLFGFGLGGYALDAACASSLYALKLACAELAAGRADVMLAGGVSRPDSLYTQMGFSQLRALSSSGCSRPFDEEGDGLVVGEGAGMVVLKRLTDAQQDGDPIWGVIRGLGTSNDLEGSLLAPHSEGQLRAMREAYAQAGWDPGTVDLFECHATGTPKGDAVEVASLRALRGEGARASVIGSVKSNVGHLLTAAGAAGLIKTLYALRSRTLPPTANYRRSAAAWGLDEANLRVLNAPEPWPSSNAGARRAAVSAFGFGGINAHLLIEEYIALSEPASSGLSEDTAPHDENESLRMPRTEQEVPPAAASVSLPPRVAIVGMGCHFGGLRNLKEFQVATLRGGELRRDLEYGAHSRAGREVPGLERDFSGNYLPDDVEVSASRFRIPPREWPDMLPQQALMLRAADEALRDAGGVFSERKTRHARVGAYIGIGLDARTTDYHRRWHRLKLGLEPDTPPLTSDRTLGALGGMVASRLAREFRFGGPTHTIQAEEMSAYRAFEAGVRALQRHELDAVLVGAVDVPGDARVLAARQREGHGVATSEGAGALVLKRLEDATRDGDRIYAVVEGLASAGTSTLASAAAPPDTATVIQATQKAWEEAGRSLSGAGILELDGWGLREEHEAVASLWAHGADMTTAGARASHANGQPGIAGGAASLIRAALCLYFEVLPQWDLRKSGPVVGAVHLPRVAQHWFFDRSQGVRRAGVNVLGFDGSAGHVVLAATECRESARDGQSVLEHQKPLVPAHYGLFALAGSDKRALLQQIEALTLHRRAESSTAAVSDLARSWWRERGCGQGTLGLAIVARDTEDLDARLREAALALAGDVTPGCDVTSTGAQVFHVPDPLGPDTPITFVFPGSGNHYVGMGVDLWLKFPQVARRHADATHTLATQVRPARLVPWRREWPAHWEEITEAALSDDHRSTLLAQVAHGAMMHDTLGLFGIRPRAVLGYSLGETAALVATRAWSDRDELTRRMVASKLFTVELGGRYAAAARHWGLPAGVPAMWREGVVDRGPDAVREAARGISCVYLLIVNAPGECVVGGEPGAVAQLVERLGCRFVTLEGVTSVHCEVVAGVEEAYRALHDMPTVAPEGVDFYSGHWGQRYVLNRQSAVDALVGQAKNTLDFPAVVRAAFRDGRRIFLEVGPRNSCTRMIRAILGSGRYMARSACVKGVDAELSLLRVLAHLHAERIPVDLAPLYGEAADWGQMTPRTLGPLVRVPLHGGVSLQRETRETVPELPVKALGSPAPAASAVKLVLPRRKRPSGKSQQVKAASGEGRALQALDVSSHWQGVLERQNKVVLADAGVQAAYDSYHKEQRLGLLAMESLEKALKSLNQSQKPSAVATGVAPPPCWLDRAGCLAFARGEIAPVLGDYFSPVDTYPTRVRLPDEPLMLVDRIMSISGERGSLSHGTIVTEHDVLPGAWYLDSNRIPTCVAVEAGQADLFLSAWLGIDFKTRGLSVYRLLDAVVTFHGPLPAPGQTIHYDIAIDRFLDQSGVTLFFFRFDATVDGIPLMTMREGCAGFFSETQLAEGRGIVFSALESRPAKGRWLTDWKPPVTFEAGRLAAPQLTALREGDLVGAFGAQFAGLPFDRATTIPDGRMRLVDRVVHVDPSGGRWGMGLIRAEHDVVPDAWYLTCHFVDDQVMPGTLMYECCMHTLRVFLLGLGWVGPAGSVIYEPVSEVKSRLKCRGQVLATTRLVTYEVSLKELGFDADGVPYVLADALMFADDKPIVLISDMSVKASGLTRASLDALWELARANRIAKNSPGAPMTLAPQAKNTLYGPETILAFAVGKPSDAFGERYRVFDEERIIARLPGPPYMFLDRVVAVGGKPWVCEAGAWCEAEYDVPPDAWYFSDEGQPTMPFGVLLEVALQPCGWLAAYVGSALTSPVDLSFRNLGGRARQNASVVPEMGTLKTRATLTKVSQSAGMIIQEFEFSVTCDGTAVYSGWTMFGFFTKAALAQQVGLRGVEPFELPASLSSPYPNEFGPMPRGKLSLLAEIDHWSTDGGRYGRGCLRGRKRVDPRDWYFSAHFYQDPVCPGSLGLEALVHLLKAEAWRRWGALTPGARFEALQLNTAHEWQYRGQIVPSSQEVVVEAHIKHCDDEARSLVADGLLMVDGRPIYSMSDFAITLRSEGV